MYYRDAHLHDINRDVCSDMDLKGLKLDFPTDSSSTKSKTRKPITKSHKRPLSGAVANNTSGHDEHGFSHSKTRLKEEYDLVKDWPKLGKETLGQVSGVALDSSGNVIIFHRGKRTWRLK